MKKPLVENKLINKFQGPQIWWSICEKLFPVNYLLISLFLEINVFVQQGHLND